MKIRFGDCVRLKSGGARMLVVDLSLDGSILACAWVGEGGRRFETTIPAVCVYRVA